MIRSADPRAGYLAQKEEIDRAIRDVMERGTYILGSEGRRFEEGFAAYLQAAHCVGVASGSDAVQLALRACGVGPGDGVIAPSQTAGATVAAIDWIGAKPVLVDIERETYTLSPPAVAETLRDPKMPRIRAVVAVHLYGRPAPMEQLMRIADAHGVPVVEDCAQAHGATIGGRKVGTIGVCGAFSFYPTKNLGGYGDGGAVATGDSAVADRLRRLRQYGWEERHVSREPGYNSRLDEIQAAILNCKLPRLDPGNARRREIARRYTEGLAHLPLQTPVERPGGRHVYHQYVIRLPDREPLRKFLEQRKVGTAVLYPVPVHLQLGYRDRVARGAGGLAETERAAREILCLPIYPELRDEEVATVIAEIRSYFQGAG